MNEEVYLIFFRAALEKESDDKAKDWEYRFHRVGIGLGELGERNLANSIYSYCISFTKQGINSLK